MPGSPPEDHDFLLEELVEEFHGVPDEWKEVALEHVRTVARLSTLPAVRMVGDDDLPAEPEESAV
jgi:hypothetical protein